jgi:hypothetical protein
MLKKPKALDSLFRFRRRKVRLGYSNYNHKTLEIIVQ